MTDTELLKELEQRAEAYHDKVKKDFAIEELEQIKAEFEEKSYDMIDAKYFNFGYKIIDLDVVNEILDRHIAELKGEQDNE